MNDKIKEFMNNPNINKITYLMSNNLPIPIMSCNNCKGIVYKLDEWYECPNCGSSCTQYSTGYIDKYSHELEARRVEWVDKCNQSKAYLSNK